MNLFRKVPLPKQSYSYQFLFEEHQSSLDTALNKSLFAPFLESTQRPMISIILPKIVFSFQQNEIKAIDKIQSVFFMKMLKQHSLYTFYRTETIEILTPIKDFETKNKYTMMYNLKDINKKNSKSAILLLHKEFKNKTFEFIENKSLSPFINFS